MRWMLCGVLALGLGLAAVAQEKPAEDKPAAETKPDPKAEYEKALDAYHKAKEDYDSAKIAYASKMTEGKKKVDELNQRFGDWYYVISAGSFNDGAFDKIDVRIERAAGG